ncbi:branched-chain amino acid aminotransferase [Macrococcoides caseolyticum]|uniref:Branched-chain amino acid aminotransferase n=2 Tax=Macrococcoides caseolyticum TaxID=69966 RepID=A0ACC9MS04_9STAP|nr:branched-chain amino acid aminotransferase [Macrococcus caseolyticus]ARQ05562.1 putative branched-chain-amino-acid aminotransferase [Macrococcus caseolyticus]PKD99645.1 branched-chain amino acid aminotransferase [Macrococcus caseolyticus]PKE06235.1 branched-chain amino acid aminotransferase [Macrococcus caseolyticus]PKE17218.1 branched-chain amino acid aminotransferase [Macrococcus caseolyticus]PKE24008.1 branched-chain amino acid aminotransferase [Macrococcus caseolyticus]
MVVVFEVEERMHKQQKPDPENLGFGKFFTDYMFSMDYSNEEGWHNKKIIPYQEISMSPASQVLHYGQAVFEGLKAYKTQHGVQLFRPDQNFKRMNRSCERLEIPKIDVEEMVQALKQLVELEKDWIPSGAGQSLYIRPIVFANEPFLGVRPAISYKFLILLSPVGAYYGGGQLSPTKIYVEDEYVRAVRGGVGFAKAAGNYAASLIAQSRAEKLGYDQVLWLDGVEQAYIEEVGSMNIFFVIDNKLVTPELNGSILPGITRKSILELAEHLGYEVEERRISIQEVVDSVKNGSLTEVFGAGTAVVISPVGEIKYKEDVLTIGDGNTGKITEELYSAYTSIQSGSKEDPFGWCVLAE